jgi:hypothetical protein
MVKRKINSQIVNLTPNNYKLGIALTYLHVRGVTHTVRMLSLKSTILFPTSPQSKVYTQSYGPPKLREFEFRDSNLGAPGQNDIWV